ncbi:hypothetical protein [Streptomyces sp. NPDC005408]|uniref:hypothetical protein n=1 Tax=Streptomyces sp. NPDC005408 TaxID=3155341 RepID=UPI00339E6275
MAMAILSASGCTEQKPAGKPPKQRISITQINRYTDLARLRRDSMAVVIATAAATGTGSRDGIPVTATQVEISKVVSGKLGKESVTVQQIGTADVASPDTSRLMEVGRTYLLYLSRNDGTKNLDRFVITGGDGIYLLHGGRYMYQGGPQKRSGDRLPASIDAEKVEAAVVAEAGS